MAFCKNCGAEIKDNDKFCTKCGNKIDNVKGLAIDSKILDNISKILDNILSTFDKNTFKSVAKIIALVIIAVFLALIMRFIFSYVLFSYYSVEDFFRNSKIIIIKSIITIIFAVIVGFYNEYNFKKTLCCMLICFLAEALKFWFLSLRIRAYGEVAFVDVMPILLCSAVCQKDNVMLIVLYSAVCQKDNVNKYIYIFLPSVFFVFLNCILGYLSFFVYGFPLSWGVILSPLINLLYIGILYYYVKTVIRFNIIKSVLFNIFIFFGGYVISFYLAELLIDFVGKYVIIDGGYVNYTTLLKYGWFIAEEAFLLIILYIVNRLTYLKIRKKQLL